MTEIDLCKCTAYDETGREFKKDVRLYTNNSGKWIISWGGWCEFYIEDLLKKEPYTTNLYIDAMGRNHYGSPVFIKFEDLNKIFEMIKERGLIENAK